MRQNNLGPELRLTFKKMALAFRSFHFALRGFESQDCVDRCPKLTCIKGCLWLQGLSVTAQVILTEDPALCSDCSIAPCPLALPSPCTSFLISRVCFPSPAAELSGIELMAEFFKSRQEIFGSFPVNPIRLSILERVRGR